MFSIRKNRHGRAFSYVLLVAMVVSLSPLCASSVAADSQTQTVLLFKVKDESARAIHQVPKMATDSLQMAIDTVPGLECTEFSASSPLVRRAAAEGRVLTTQIETGPVDARDAIRIGRALSVDMVVIASIQSYRTTPQPQSVEVVVAGQAYKVAPNYDEATGDTAEKLDVEQAFGVVGTSRQLPGYAAKERTLAREAIDDATYRIASVLKGKSMTEVAKPRPQVRKSSKSKKILAYLAALGVIAWLVSESGGGNDTGPSADAVPPTPLPLQVEGSDTVRVSWQAPTGTSFTVLRYQVQRSKNGGGWSYFGLGSASSNISATSSEIPDSVEPGNTYNYRIRVVYTNQKFSRWVLFSGVAL